MYSFSWIKREESRRELTEVHYLPHIPRSKATFPRTRQGIDSKPAQAQDASIWHLHRDLFQYPKKPYLICALQICFQLLHHFFKGFQLELRLNQKGSEKVSEQHLTWTLSILHSTEYQPPVHSHFILHPSVEET